MTGQLAFTVLGTGLNFVKISFWWEKFYSDFVPTVEQFLKLSCVKQPKLCKDKVSSVHKY